jgi:1,4-alpha-glucan branching enzyme
MHAGVQRLVQDINGVYRDRPALWELDTSPDGFSWIDANDAAGNTLSFLRLSRAGEVLACVANFSGEPHHGYRLGLPSAGRWREVINTDAGGYGGSGVGNLGVIEATDEPWHGRPASATISVPPLGVLWLAPEDATPAGTAALEPAAGAKAAAEPAAEPETEAAAKPETDAAAKPETGTAAKPETGTAAKPETGTAAKPETDAAAKPETDAAAETSGRAGQ